MPFNISHNARSDFLAYIAQRVRRMVFVAVTQRFVTALLTDIRRTDLKAALECLVCADWLVKGGPILIRQGGPLTHSPCTLIPHVQGFAVVCTAMTQAHEITATRDAVGPARLAVHSFECSAVGAR